MRKRFHILGRTLRYCLIAFGVAAVLALVLAAASAEWRPHFYNLLQRAWIAFEEVEGGKTAGIISTWLDPFLIIAISLGVIWHVRGWSALMDRAREEIITALRVTVVVCLVLYGPVFVWQFVKTVYVDHQGLVVDNTTLRTKLMAHPRGLTLNINQMGISKVDKENSTWVVIFASVSNTGTPTIADAWVLYVQLIGASQRMRVLPTMFTANKPIVFVHPNGQNKTYTFQPSDALYLKTSPEPIKTGAKVTGLIYFKLPGISLQEAAKEGTVYRLEAFDVSGNKITVDYPWRNEPTPLSYPPGMIPPTVK